MGKTAKFTAADGDFSGQFFGFLLEIEPVFFRQIHNLLRAPA